MNSLKGTSALITGSSKGIGRAIAESLVQEGVAVMLTARSEEDLNKAQSELKAKGANVSYFPADISKSDDISRLVEATLKSLGKIDILINNAGIGTFKPVYDMSIEDWRKVLDTNLNGIFYLTREVLPYMRRQKSGYIINISSLAGQNPFAGGAAYCASKAALNSFSECLMQDVRQDNIRVSYICPGSVNTEFGSNATTPNSWKIDPHNIGAICVHLLTIPEVSLASKVELRPSKPPKK